MNLQEFNEKIEAIKSIAKKYDYIFVSTDTHVGRVSFRNRISTFRIDIYTTKMTVCILPKGDNPEYHKNQSFESIEKIFKGLV